MTPAERQAELEDKETELLHVDAQKAVGGAPENAGRIKELRRTIARIKTIQREEGDLDEEVGAAAGQPGGARRDERGDEPRGRAARDEPGGGDGDQ